MKQPEWTRDIAAPVPHEGSRSLPDDEALAAALAHLHGGQARKPARILDRRPNADSSTFASEIVTCQGAGEKERLAILCKYDLPIRALACEHRNGIGYEARVYREMLERSACTSPRYYSYCDGDGATAGWLAIEYLPEAVKIERAMDPAALVKAGAWLGHFHREQETGSARATVPPLTRFDAAFYRQWSEWTAANHPQVLQRHPLLKHLCEQNAAHAAELAEPPLTVVHAEFYPSNVLFDAGRVLPIDWESAGIGAGELDLAALTDRWPAEMIGACEQAYCNVRWGGSPPETFERRLRLARLHLIVRWLSDGLSKGGHRRQKAIDAAADVARQSGVI